MKALAQLVPVLRRLVVFGGRKQNKRRLNDVYFLDLTNWTWCGALCSFASIPLAAAECACLLVGPLPIRGQGRVIPWLLELLCC